MKISLNKIEFDVVPVSESLRAVVLADPIIAQGVTRDVWHWDRPAGKAAVLVPLTKDRAVPLPNGICFFVAKPGVNGLIQKAETPTLKMSARFLEVVGAKSMLDVMQALNRIVNLPQKTIPVDSFAWLRPHASFKIVQHIEYAVVELAQAARNLSAYFVVPGQVYYSFQVTEMVDQAGYAAQEALDPKQVTNRPGFIVPASTKANDAIRRVALAQRISEIRAGLAGVHPNDLAMDDPRRGLIARMGIEWNALTAAARKTATA
jgi:hypothetical protein